MITTTVIPVYNESGDRLIRSINSVLDAIKHAHQAGLASTSATPPSGPYHEIVVVDDGSDPQLLAIDSALVRHIRIEHGGISAAMNAGIRAARGDYISWLSAGDTYTFDRIRRVCDVLTAMPTLAAVFHDFSNNHGTYRVGDGWEKRLCTDNQFCLSTATVSRQVALDHPLDESLEWCQDWDWACRIQYEGPGWHYLRENLMYGDVAGSKHTRTADPKLRHLCRARVAKRWRDASKYL